MAGMVRQGNGMVRLGLVLHGEARLGMVRQGKARFGN